MKMNNNILVLTLLLLFSSIGYAQFPLLVNEIDAESNKVTEYDGDLDDGRKISDLSWASKSTVACFPATQNKKFTGNHVLHGFVLPAYSEVTITLEPHNRKANLSLYGYQVGTSFFPVVPKLNSCVSCEADHKWDYNKAGQTQDHTRSIKFNAFKNSYNVFIGVAGADELSKCDYTLKIDIKSRDKNIKSQEKLKIYAAASEANATRIYKGNLKDGVLIHDLSWASSSSNACFPATQNKKFTGNHILFVSDIPAYSEMDIELIPDDKNANMSIYGFMTGTTSSSMVPNLRSCITCEADHKWDYPKKNQTQDHRRSIRFNAIKNPYRIVIGIAGADGLKDGGFVIKLKTKSRVMINETQQKLKVFKAAAVPNETKVYRGSLKDGCKIHDLSWAASSSNACFPATQNKKFTGNHIMYVTEIPPYSKMEITVVPTDKNANMSIYAYMTGTNSDAMVPNLPSCVSCEAQHKWDYPKKNQTQDHTRTVYLNAIKNPYRVVIGVAGADGLTEGDFIVKIKTISSTQVVSNQKQEKLKVYSAPSEKGQTKAFRGDLNDGVKIHDLSWASTSSNACFPGTQNKKFTGNHILYVTEIPPHSKMAITVVPEDKNSNMSIYAYMTGTNSNAIVPKLPSCVTCEAEHKWDYPKKNKTQDHTRTVYLNAVNNPYRVVIGVAGADGLTTGKFIVKIKTE